jgi:hypothetical protein
MVAIAQHTENGNEPDSNARGKFLGPFRKADRLTSCGCSSTRAMCSFALELRNVGMRMFSLVVCGDAHTGMSNRERPWGTGADTKVVPGGAGWSVWLGST